MDPCFKKTLSTTDELIRVFALGRVVHPIVVEMFGLAGGYHGFWIDQEHSGITTDQIVNVTLAARANQFDSFVRMPPIGYWQVTQAFEAGAGGVMAAQIFSFEEAELFVSWTKFSPQGTRGLNTSGRDSNYTHKAPAQFAEDANRDHFIAIQIETLGAVEDVDAIAAIENVDMLFIGPADLSLALGIVGQFHHEKLWEVIGRVSQACKKHGKHWGVVPADPQFADRAVELGCRMLTLGNDALTLRRGIDAIKTSFSNHC